MPSSSEHRDKADRNRTFLNTINVAASPEWAATVAFYLAVHLVVRLAAVEDIHHAGHSARLDYLNRHKHHQRIYDDLTKLHDAANVARYGTVNQFSKAFPGTTVKDELLDKHLKRIESHVAGHFPKPGTMPPTKSGS